MAQRPLSHERHPRAHRLHRCDDRIVTEPFLARRVLSDYPTDLADIEPDKMVHHRPLELESLTHHEQPEIGVFVNRIPDESLLLAVAIQPVQQRIAQDEIALLRSRHPISPIINAWNTAHAALVEIHDADSTEGV